MPKTFPYVTALIVATLSPVLKGVGQEFRQLDDMISQGTSYHIFAKEGQATVQIMVLGGVGAPGVYVLGTEIELDQLIALAGGTSFSRSTAERTKVTIRLFRKESDRRELIYEAPQEEMLARPGLYPPLQDGDIVIVESITTRRNPFTWREALSIVYGITSIVFLYDRIQRIGR